MSRAAWPRIVAHADMDAFYAAIEQRDDPELKGRPVLVGPKSDRGVVLTASYEARPFGVGSAMPMAKARRLCPQAIIVPPRFDRYQEVSASLMKVLADFSPDVEALSLDEAFLEMTGAEHFFGGPEAMGGRIKSAVHAATGLTVSVGLSATKYVAKVASGHEKPDGLTVVPPAQAKAWLAPQPVSRLWGAGPKTQARLHALGLRTIGQVADTEPAWLAQQLGVAGRHFFALAHAEDPRRVSGTRKAKSIGSERTLSRDVSAREDIARHLRRSADGIGQRLRRKGYAAEGVRVKLKTSDFRILTRQRRLTEPTDMADSLYRVALELLSAFDDPGPFRLVGMAAYDISTKAESAQLDLLAGRSRQRGLEDAVDALVERFGPDAVRRAADLRDPGGVGIAANLDFIDEASDED